MSVFVPDLIDTGWGEEEEGGGWGDRGVLTKTEMEN